MSDARAFEDRESAVEIAKRTEAVGGAGAPFEPRRAKVFTIAPDNDPPPIETEISTMGGTRAAAVAVCRARAMTAVALTMAEAGQDPRCWRPYDATTAFTVADMLLAVMDAKKVILPVEYRQGSTAGEIAKADKVANAASGGEAA